MGKGGGESVFFPPTFWPGGQRGKKKGREKERERKRVPNTICLILLGCSGASCWYKLEN